MSGNTVECDGAVSFIVTYLGADRTLAAVPFTVANSVPVELPECPENALPGEIYTDCTVDSSGARATDARKLSLKAHLKVRVFGDMRIKTDEKYSDENGQKPGTEGTVAVENGLTLEQVYNSIHPHPTVTEIILEVCKRAVGLSFDK